MAFEPDRRSGEIVLWTDTAASLQRLVLGLGIATLVGLAFGLAIGLLPLVARDARSASSRCISMIPPMAILPILFIVFGLGELSKVVLIVIGIAPFLIRDLSLAVGALPAEQIVKAQTLGASTWQMAIRVVLPQVMPRLIDAVRLSLGPALLFLISAEAIAADERARLPHLPGAALSRDGRDPALRRLDHACSPISWTPRLRGCRARRFPWAHMQASGADERDHRAATSGSNTATRSCSSASISRSRPAPSSRSSARRAAARAPSCACSSARSGRPAAASCSTARRCRPSRGRDRGIVFQRYSVFPHLTVLGNVADRLRVRRRARCSARLVGAARREAIAKKPKRCSPRSASDAHRDKYPSALSGGMQQRLAIAQALAREPRVLLLDEPFGALDPGTRAQMHALIRPLWRERGMTIFMVTHDIKEAFTLGTRLIAFDRPRRDPQAPGRFGATITYDLDLTRDCAVPVLGFSKPLDVRPDAGQAQGANA